MLHKGKALPSGFRHQTDDAQPSGSTCIGCFRADQRPTGKATGGAVQGTGP